MPLDFDFEVGTDATAPSLLPGKDQATTGHHYVAIFPKKEGTGGPEKRESTWANTSGQGPPTTGGRTTIGDSPRDTPADIDQHPSPSPVPVAAAETTTVRTHFPMGKEQKMRKTDDQGIGAFRAAQPPEQKPTIGEKYTDHNPWAEPVTAGDTLTGATSQDVYNVHNAQQSGHSGQGHA